MFFANRTEAGVRLSDQLSAYKGRVAVVIGLARGGVVVAKAIASTLTLPLDVLSIKKITPMHDPELALGAVAPDGVTSIDYSLAQRMGIDDRYLQEEIRKKSVLVKQTMQQFRKGRQPFSVDGKQVIIADDGAATGATIVAAIKWLRKKKAKRIVVALPVAPLSIVHSLKPEADELVILETPNDFSSVGQFYGEFAQISDADVIQLLS